jgi:Lipase (class 3)
MTLAEFSACLSPASLNLEALIGNWNGQGTQAYFATNDDFAILAFRGTEKDDPTDQLDDADLFLVPEPDHRRVPLQAAPALWHLSRVEQWLSPDACLVHRGFQRALDRVWDQVHQLVTAYRTNHPAAEICLTGHSLGAALATLAFSRLADPAISLITIGCPRVGNGAFRNRVLENECAPGIHRFVNLNDPVAHIPLESLLYRQAPDNCLRFDTQGVLSDDSGSFQGDVSALRVAIAGLPASLSAGLATVNAPDGLVDHSPARYCIRLWNACAP